MILNSRSISIRLRSKIENLNLSQKPFSFLRILHSLYSSNELDITLRIIL